MRLVPEISAIITTFNRACYLKCAIKSVLAQGYQDFELLILDNNSTDDTETVVSSFKDNRIRYIKHSPLNISRTRNLGVKEAKGNFIAFLDDDDEWLPNKLGDELSLFKSVDDDVAMVYGGFIRMDTNGKQFYTHKPFLRGNILKELLTLKDDFTASASNPMIRKSVVLELKGFDEKVLTGEDWEFYLRLAERYKIEFVSQAVVKVRHHYGVRLGDRLRDYIELEADVMKRFDSIFSSDKHLKSFYFQRIGGKYLRLGDVSKGRQYLRTAIQFNWFNFVAYLQCIFSFFPKSVYNFFHRVYLNSTRSVKNNVWGGY